MSTTLPKAANFQGISPRHQVLTETTFKNNSASNYTEIIEELDQSFDYQANRDRYWGPPELSLFFGTPLYNAASEAQKLALNHLYWVTQYNQTAATEANAILYNQVTEGVFSAVGGYDILCDELALETEQEHHHIHAFHSVGHATRKALLGPGKLAQPRPRLVGRHSKRPPQNSSGSSSLSLLKLPSFDWARIQEEACRSLSVRLSSGHGVTSYSNYLTELAQKGKRLPVQKAGLLGQVVPAPLSKFLTINFGSSPFSACFFYATRYLANMLLKNYEYRYLQYYRALDQAGQPIPAPTAISFFHMLDESFHTTTSQLISQDLYKEFTHPTPYEQLMANLMFYRGQEVMLSGLSGVLPATFRTDSPFLQPLYQILRSSIFSMDHQESIEWLERCLCEEHDGYHMNVKHHQRLLSTMRQAFLPLHYLWDVNRNLSVMANGVAVERNIALNRKHFEEFRTSMEPESLS